MNARVKVVSGHFQIVGQITDDKLDELAKLLGLSKEDHATLKGNSGLIVVGPLPGNPTS